LENEEFHILVVAASFTVFYIAVLSSAHK